MKKMIMTSTVCFFMYILFACSNMLPISHASETIEAYPVEKVIDTIRTALKEAQSNNIAGFPPLKEVTISLKTVAVNSGGIKANFLVFSAGGSIAGESLSEIVLKMEPPVTKKSQGLQSIKPENLKNTLAQAINTAKASIIAGNTAEPRLILKNLTVNISFTVTKAAEGGVSIVDILPVGLEGTGKYSKNQTHSLSLLFSY